MKKTLTIICFILISLFVIFLNHFPDYYAQINTPQNMVFSGQASWFDPWDINVYVSAISWGQHHGILLQNAYTTTPNPPVLYYPTYTLTGWFFPKVNPFLLFHLLAIVSGLILLFTIWKLAQVFLKSQKESLIALFLISLGGGIGFLLYPNFHSADLFMTGFTLSSQFQRGHEALGMVFYLLALTLFFLAVKKKQIRYYLFSGLSLGLLTFFYPFYILSFLLISGIYSFKRKISIFWVAESLFGVLATFLYVSHLSSNPTFGSVLSQNLATPNILEILTGLGILTPFIIYAFRSRQTDETSFLNIWLIVSLILAFLPLGFARFYLRLIFFPAAILALKTKPAWWITLTLIILLPVSQLFTASKRLAEAGGSNPWIYQTLAENNLLSYLSHLPNQSGILAGYTLSNNIPSHTDQRVYFGHLIQTPKAEEKLQNMVNFYANKFSDKQALQFLKDNHISYIVFDSSVSASLKYFFLKPVFEKDSLTLFSY